MSDLRQQLQSTLGNAYTIERELGGGGMSRVFLAEEVRLGRQVVLKLLPGVREVRQRLARLATETPS